MSAFRQLPFSVLLASILLVACDTDDVDQSRPAAADPAPPVGAQSGNAAIEEVAAAPIAVNGTYLMRCSRETASSFVTDRQLAANLTACLVRDRAGAKVDAKVESVRITVAGKAVFPALVSKAARGSPWTVGFELDPADARAATEITLGFRDTRGMPASATSRDVTFDWTSSPAFNSFLDLWRRAAAVFGSLKTFDQYGGIAACEGRDLDCHVAFATDETYPGDIGRAHADDVCARVGAKFDSKRSWFADLRLAGASSGVFAARGEIFDFAGMLVAATPADYVAGNWVSRLDLTPSGAQVGRIPAGLGPTAFVTRAWQGSTAASCQDFSSAKAGAQGIALDLGAKSGAGRELIVPCAAESRLICLGTRRGGAL